MEIKLGERNIPLFLSTLELLDIQNDIGCTVAEMKDKVFGYYEDDEDLDDAGQPKKKLKVAVDPSLMRKLGTLIRIMGNAGLEESGQEADLTDKWVMRHMKPGLAGGYAMAVWVAVLNAMTTESSTLADEEQKGPVDVTIEEENRKKEPEK